MTTHDAIQYLVSTDAALLPSLTKVELSVLLFYISKADPQGVSYWSAEKVAAHVGTGANHVRAARLALVERGVLLRLPRDGINAPYQVAFMASKPSPNLVDDACITASEIGTSPQSGLVPNQDAKASRIRTQTRPESGRKVVPNPDSKPVHEPEQEPVQQPARASTRKNEGGEGAAAPVGKPASPANAKTAPPPGFARWWATYPDTAKRVDFDDCEAIWVRDGLEARTDEIVAHLAACVISEQWTKEGGRFAPSPLTYLGKRRYQARPPAAAAKPLQPANGHGHAVAQLVAARELSQQRMDRDLALLQLDDGELAQLAADVRAAMPAHIGVALAKADPRKDETLRWKMYEHLNARLSAAPQTAEVA